MEAKAVMPYTRMTWRRVRSLFNSDESSDVEEVYNILCMYMNRMSVKCPLFIQCTHLVFACLQLRCKLQKNPQDSDLHDNYRNKMEVCILKFVNFTNELAQAKNSQVFLSMSVALQRLALPSWLVNIRHEIAHGTVNAPNFQLEKGIACARQWLWEHAWKNEQLAIVDEDDAEEQTKRKNHFNKFVNMLSRYIDWCKKERNTGQYSSVDQDVLIQQPILREISLSIADDPDYFMQIFVSSHCLFHADAEINNFDQATQTITIPEKTQLLFAPILRLFYHHRAIGTFIIRMLKLLYDKRESNKPDEQQFVSQLIAWSELTIEGVLIGTTDFKGKLPTDDWQRIFHRLILLPEFFDKGLILKVLQKVPTFDEVQRTMFTQLLEATQDANLDSAINFSVELTPELLRAKIDEQIATAKSANKILRSTDNMWLIDPLPLGLLPGQTIESLNLVIDDEYLARQDALFEQAKNT